MPKQPKDDVKTDKWSIAFLSSTGAGVHGGGSIAIFDLFNRVTNRAHRMTVSAAGASRGASASFRDTGYHKFETKVPANFSDFHGRRAKIEISDRLGRSCRELEVLQRGSSEPLMEIEINNWNLTGWLGFKGQGITEVLFSDGKPVGNPDYELNVELKTREPLPIRFKWHAYDWGGVIRMPDDVLFDFDKDWLHYQASQALSDTLKYINVLPPLYKRMEVVGHTDSLEKVPGYNLNLSLRRARTVTDWIVKYKSWLERDYVIEPPRGVGASDPVAPNRNPDGNDNPEGRAQNRRVEIWLHKH
jgi:outer membrane protein OmpA-like peptidoglycan-associated protein